MSNIIFNDPRLHSERANTRPLTLAEENHVIEILNERIKTTSFDLSEVDIAKIQAFIWHYENLCHDSMTKC